MIGVLGMGVLGCQIEDAATIDVDRMLPLLCEQAETCRCAAPSQDETACEDKHAVWDARLQYGRTRGLIYDPSCIEQIEEDVAAYDCRAAIQETGHLCESFCAVFHGNVPFGETCESYDAVTSNCVQGATCLEGTCVAPCDTLAGLDEGAACRRMDDGEQFDDCAAGMRCDFETLTCQRLPEVGQSCRESNGDCTSGAYCDWETDTCRAAGQQGQTCRERGCAAGLRCDYDQDRCRPPAGEGENCYEVGCESGLDCDGNGRCAEPAREGESCDGLRCATGLWCDWNLDGRCAPLPDGEGQPCESGECAGRLWCDTSNDPSGECRLRAPQGEACAGHRQCDSGYCPAGFCTELPLLGEDCREANACGNGLVCDGELCVPALNRGSAICSFVGW